MVDQVHIHGFIVLKAEYDVPIVRYAHTPLVCSVPLQRM